MTSCGATGWLVSLRKSLLSGPVSRAGISDLERGAREVPRKDTLQLLVRALDLPSADRDA